MESARLGELWHSSRHQENTAPSQHVQAPGRPPRLGRRVSARHRAGRSASHCPVSVQSCPPTLPSASPSRDWPTPVHVGVRCGTAPRVPEAARQEVARCMCVPGPGQLGPVASQGTPALVQSGLHSLLLRPSAPSCALEVPPAWSLTAGRWGVREVSRPPVASAWHPQGLSVLALCLTLGTKALLAGLPSALPTVGTGPGAPARRPPPLPALPGTWGRETSDPCLGTR